jgi:hypothetical protein
VDSLARKAKQAAGKGFIKDMYMLTRKISEKSQQTESPAKDKDGNPLTTEESYLGGHNTLSNY